VGSDLICVVVAGETPDGPNRSDLRLFCGDRSERPAPLVPEAALTDAGAPAMGRRKVGWHGY
jgi:hypothetical protein